MAVSEDTSVGMIGAEVGAFRIVRVLGSGGMGHVYEAWHRDLGSRAAIKIIREQAMSDPELLERFYLEARAIGSIHHEGIVNIYDLIVLADGRPAIVMEYLDGASLKEIISERGRVEPEVLVSWMVQITDALSAAHKAGVVHRDLKPANLFVTHTGRTEILDFGIAKLAESHPGRDPNVSISGTVLGTTPYLAPEQATGQGAFELSDVFSLGVVMYEASTGVRPYSGRNLVMLHIEHSRPLDPPSKKHLIPSELDVLICRCMAVDPASRYPSMRELHRELRALAQRMGVARPHRESVPPGRYYAPVIEEAMSMTSGPLTTVEEPLEPPTVRHVGPRFPGDSE